MWACRKRILIRRTTARGGTSPHRTPPRHRTLARRAIRTHCTRIGIATATKTEIFGGVAITTVIIDLACTCPGPIIASATEKPRSAITVFHAGIQTDVGLTNPGSASCSTGARLADTADTRAGASAGVDTQIYADFAGRAGIGEVAHGWGPTMLSRTIANAIVGARATVCA